MGEIDAKAAADKLEDVRIKGDELKITPLKAITPDEAEAAAERLYAMAPSAALPACWPTFMAGPDLRTPSPTCTQECRLTTRASS